MIWADLHTHSTWSDGSQTLAELVFAARQRALTHLAVTDHDTTLHFAPLRSLGGKTSVKLLAGVEISAYDPDSSRKIHLLGYGLQRTKAVEDLCLPIRTQRNAMTERSICLLAETGYHLDIEQVKKMNGFPTILYKQHIMKVLVEHGIADSIYGATYKQLFKSGGPCSEEISYCHWKDALQAVREDGGVAVLAHPGQQDLWDLVPNLVACGLAGIELYHESHSLEDHRLVMSLAHQYTLFMTGGSDTHGSLGSLHTIGSIVAPVSIGESILSELFF